MKRFEVEVDKNTYCIVLFDRAKITNEFVYEGKAYVSAYPIVNVTEEGLFFCFRFTRDNIGWQKPGPVEITNFAEEVSHRMEYFTDILIREIRRFEEGSPKSD